MPSSYADVAERGVISGSGSGSTAVDDSRAAVTPSFSSLALLSGLAWCEWCHGVVVEVRERHLGFGGVYSGAVAMVLSRQQGIGQRHV